MSVEPQRAGMLVQLAVIALAITAVTAIRPMVTYRALGLGAGPFEVGLIAAVFSIAPALLAVAVGRAIDRVGEVWFIRGALLLMTAGGVTAALAGSLTLLAISQVATGLGHVTNLIAGQTLMANFGTQEGRDHRFGYYSTMGSFGHLAGPLLGTSLVGTIDTGLAANDNPEAPAFLAAAGLTLVAFALAWLLPQRGAHPGAAADGEGRGSLLRSVRSVLSRSGMPFAMAVSMIVASSVDVLIAYLPLYGEARGITVGTVGLLLTIRAAASMVSRIFMARLIAILGRNRLLALSMGGATGGLLALPLLAEPVALGALMVIIGLGLGIGQPMTMAWVANRSPHNERGTALGVRLTGNRTALVVMPVLVGALAGVAGVSLIFWLMAALLGAGAALGYRAPLDTAAPPRPLDAGAP